MVYIKTPSILNIRPKVKDCQEKKTHIRDTEQGESFRLVGRLGSHTDPWEQWQKFFLNRFGMQMWKKVQKGEKHWCQRICVHRCVALSGRDTVDSKSLQKKLNFKSKMFVMCYQSLISKLTGISPSYMFIIANIANVTMMCLEQIIQESPRISWISVVFPLAFISGAWPMYQLGLGLYIWYWPLTNIYQY